MPNDTNPHSIQNVRSRLGFHYFPDTLHYRECDLQTWLSELKKLGAAWLTLVAPPDRAIPETFICGLMHAGIQPILHFQLPLLHQFQDGTLDLLFRAYASWGVSHVVLFDRPNQRSVWPAATWAQSDLVERFLDIYLPVANSALQAGLTPVFPPLEPGGDYWDTAFLRAALQGMERRGETGLLDALHLSAYAWVSEHLLEWGKGGPERWPGVHPYFTPPDEQDQRGFYIFDWYLAEAQAALGKPIPIILLAAGRRLHTTAESPASEIDELEHANINLSIARKFIAGVPSEEVDEPLSPYVLACNFWLLAADPPDPSSNQAWFQPDDYRLPIVAALHRLVTTNGAGYQEDHPPLVQETKDEPAYPPHSGALEEKHPSPIEPKVSSTLEPSAHPVAHYLLLPRYAWGVSEWHLDAARPFILKYHPTVGFSPTEAALAARVTVVGGEQVFPEELINEMCRRGCQVTRIVGDGTEIASQLAST